jgi:hypothetical protein
MSGVARCLGAVLAASLVTSPVLANQHAVSTEEAATRLAAAAAGGVASLTEAERRDLARRADALQTDPVAGASAKKTLIIVGVVVLVAVVLAIAIVESCKEQGAECLDK